MTLTLKTDGPGRAWVLRDGERAGHVQRYEQHYNIAPRPLKITYWRLFLSGHDYPRHFRTRREALQFAQEEGL